MVRLQRPGGEPRVRWLNDAKYECTSQPTLNINYFSMPAARAHMLTHLPDNYPPPLIKWHAHELTINVHLYGGADFGRVAAHSR
jgi:hypothetical protein